MELKPGYKQTEVGVIPEDWHLTTIGAVSDKVGSGITPTGGNRVYQQYGRVFVRSQNVGWGSVLLDDVAFIDEATHATFPDTEIRCGDALLNITGASIGRCAVATEELSGGNVNQHVCIIRAIPRELNSYFLNFVLLSPIGQRQIESFQAGGNRQGLNFAQVRSIRLPLPPSIDEQTAIANSLSDVDALLAAQDALIAKKRAIKQGAMQELLTGKRRLPGFSGEWEVRRLGDHLQFLSNGANSRAELTSSGRVKYLHYGDIHVSSEVFLDPALTAMPFLPDEKAVRLDRLRDGDLVFADASEDLDGVGKSIEIRNVQDTQVVSGMHTIAVRFDKTVLADGFKARLQAIPSFSEHLRRLAAGTKVYATNMAHIASAQLPLPHQEEQIAIAELLSDLDTELTALESQRAKTAQLKQGMMQALLTGRIRLV